MNGRFTAVLDRIVDGETAVLLLEENNETVDQLNVTVDKLPEEGQHERAIFKVAVTEGSLTEAEYWAEEEEKRLEEAQEWFDRTAKRPDEIDLDDIR